MDMKTEPSPADVAEAWRDSTRLNWMEAQGQFSAYEWVQPGDGNSTWELTDIDGEVVGTGATLRAAIDDAMGNRRGLPCRG